MWNLIHLSSNWMVELNKLLKKCIWLSKPIESSWSIYCKIRLLINITKTSSILIDIGMCLYHWLYLLFSRGYDFSKWLCTVTTFEFAMLNDFYCPDLINSLGNCYTIIIKHILPTFSLPLNWKPITNVVSIEYPVW